MPSLTITLTMAAAAGFLQIWHMYRCGSVRMKKGILHGDGGDTLMHRRMRAHSNFIENTPLFLILLAAIEYNIGAPLWLWSVGFAFMIGRFLHSLGMDNDGENKPRMFGTLLAALPMIGLSSYALWLAIRLAA